MENSELLPSSLDLFRELTARQITESRRWVVEQLRQTKEVVEEEIAAIKREFALDCEKLKADFLKRLAEDARALLSANAPEVERYLSLQPEKYREFHILLEMHPEPTAKATSELQIASFDRILEDFGSRLRESSIDLNELVIWSDDALSYYGHLLECGSEICIERSDGLLIPVVIQGVGNTELRLRTADGNELLMTPEDLESGIVIHI